VVFLLHGQSGGQGLFAEQRQASLRIGLGLGPISVAGLYGLPKIDLVVEVLWVIQYLERHPADFSSCAKR